MNLKRLVVDEEHALSTDVRLALIFYAQTSKNLKGYIVFALFVISFVFFFCCYFFEPLFGVKI